MSHDRKNPPGRPVAPIEVIDSGEGEVLYTCMECGLPICCVGGQELGSGVADCPCPYKDVDGNCNPTINS